MTTPGQLAQQKLHSRIVSEGKTAMLYEATAANYVTRDNMRELQAAIVRQQTEMEQLQANHDAAVETAVVFAEGIVTLHAQNGRYRAALLAVLGTDNHEDAVRAAQDGLGE